ncbi:MAG TPA: NAD(P)/FAD-dependent oxidoreductase [Rhodopila sp.]|nr:NAD(P)/FAD-dependent oxidoreductase [Rhodopila sp.]
MLDVIVVGGGLSGTIAAVVLARAGHRVALVDRHRIYPPDFRAEHMDEPQADALRRLGLLDAITAGVPCVRQVAVGRRGRLLGTWPTINYGMRYDSIVNAARALLPPGVQLLIGRVANVQTGTQEQRVLLADGRVVTGRLLIVATGLGFALCSKLGVTREMLHKGHSLTFGFDLVPATGGHFLYPFTVYQGDRVAERIDYLAAFEIGATMRANLFTFRDYREPWTEALEQEPERVLNQSLPGLAKVLGPFRVAGPVHVRATDLYTSDGFRQPGFVLIGDAFQTACPAAGKGMTRALTDVEQLCTVHVPRWLATPGMGVEKISAFYDDAAKQASDAQAMHTAHYRRAVTTETGLRWTLHRQRLLATAVARGLAQRSPAWLHRQAA